MEKYNITPDQKEKIRSLDDSKLEKFYQQTGDIINAAQDDNHDKVNQLEKTFELEHLVDRNDSYTDADYINSFRTEAYSELQRRRENS
ncbi:MAG: hypothetical protein ACLFQ0_14300 [Cyclobacteriaceae bacterium]